jgi:flagellar biosynthesis protein FlhB
MSDDADDSQKTEEATPKKLSQARERGNVPRSMEVNTWLMLFAGAIIVGAIAPGLMDDIRILAITFVERPHEFAVDQGNLGDLLGETVKAVALILTAPVVIMIVFALASGLVQNGLVYSPKAIEPKLEKISPLKGLKKFATSRQYVEFLKGLIKLAIVGTTAVILLSPEFDRIDTLSSYDPLNVLKLVHELIMRLLVYVLAILAVIALVDFIYQRMQHAKQLRMTKQEIKDEFKQAEGDPHVKGRLRQIRMDRARQRMMQAVPDADVVVTNPTHFAVALKYKPDDDMDAPMLVAKGQDLIAQKIREIATENGIMIVENKPLAQALFKNVEIDQEVPTEHYKAVAEIISYVWRIKGRVMPES